MTLRQTSQLEIRLLTRCHYGTYRFWNDHFVKNLLLAFFTYGKAPRPVGGPGGAEVLGDEIMD
jgi:hypothetical protein